MLFLGNSYTFVNELDQVVAGLYEDAGTPLSSVERLAESGYTFEDHVAQVETSGSDWDDAFGRSWEHVILQEQSQIPGFPQEQLDFIESAAAAVTLDERAAETGAETWFLMTWGRRDGDADNPELFPDFLTMQAALAEGYATYVEDASADGTTPGLIPAGLAWQRVYEDDPDPTDPSGPFYTLYQSDGSHPSVRGTWLAACVVYSTITGLAVEVDGTVDGVDDAEYLAGVAAEVVGAEVGEPDDTGDTAVDSGDELPRDTDPGSLKRPEGCGCGTGLGLGWVGVLGAVAGLRRRRSVSGR